ncbi:MAG: glycosyltransferase, partial [uncultured bacterium]
IFFSGKRVPSYLIGLGMYVIENLLPSIADSISVSSNELLKIAEKKIKNKKYLIKVPVGASHYSITQDSVELIKKKYNLTGINQIYIGQLHGGQYAELLIRACLKLKASGIQTKTLIVGDGYDKPRLENIVKELNLENEVIFTGAVLHEHIPAYLKACDIAIACFEKNNITASKSPLKIAEYISAGKAIIAHHIGEVSDMVNDAAILISPDDKDSLYNAILSLHKEPQKIKELENKACLRYKELTWDKSAEKINALFSNLSR